MRGSLDSARGTVDPTVNPHATADDAARAAAYAADSVPPPDPFNGHRPAQPTDADTVPDPVASGR